MKKTIFIIAMLLAGNLLSAQVDTLEYLSPWYQFNPLPSVLYPENSIVGSVFIGPLVGWQVQGYPNNDDLVYGVAVVIDTAHYDQTYSPADDDTSRFKVGLFRYEGEGLADEDFFYHSFSKVDSSIFNSHTRKTMFTYVTNYNGLDTSVHSCYELYFDTPCHKEDFGDSIYVGRYFDSGTGCIGIADHWLFYRSPDINHAWSNVMYSSDNTWMTYSDIEHACRGVYPWGGIFPIVQLRCTAPKRLHETGRGRGEFSIEWDAHDDAVGWQVAIAPLWASIEDGEIIDLDSATSYAFTGLDPTQNYIYSVRKTCHYATSSYDTLVTSEWFPPRRVIFNASTMEVSSAIEASFSLAPNPAHGRAEVTLAAPATTGTTVELHDLAGRLLRTLRPAAGATTLDLDLQGLPPAAYFLRLSSPAGTSVQRLLVR